jgi:hypothetical protein
MRKAGPLVGLGGLEWSRSAHALTQSRRKLFQARKKGRCASVPAQFPYERSSQAGRDGCMHLTASAASGLLRGWGRTDRARPPDPVPR